MPRLAHDSPAEYPAEVRRLGIQGRVVLELVVDEDGKVVFARVVKPLDPRLDEAALAAARKLEFSPGRLGDKATRVKSPYTYTFVLE